MRAKTEDVLVMHGAQQALDLIGRVLIEPGADVAVEEPGHPPPRERDIPTRQPAAGTGHGGSGEGGGVRLVALSRYCASTPSKPGPVHGYGAVSTARIVEGLQRLRACISVAAEAKHA